MTFYIMKPCQGKAAFEVILTSKTQIDIADRISNLEENGYDVVNAGVMLVAKKNAIVISIYPSAKLLIKCQSKEEAAQKANEIYSLMGVPEPL